MIKFKLAAISAVLMLTLMYSCDYEFIEPPYIEPPQGLSFSEDIIPIFDASCNTSGCHVQGHFAVDLTPENAFSSLFAKDMIDVATPTESRLYVKLNDGNGTHSSRSTAEQRAYILQWIEEGALDN